MSVPVDPFALLNESPFAPRERRELEFLGQPVELVWLPERAARRGVPQNQRPAFQGNFVAGILAREALWQDAGLVLTPNKYPFAKAQLILWAEKGGREPDLAMIEAGMRMQESRPGSTLVLNSIGAAASIAHPHLHLLDEALPFLSAFPGLPFDVADFETTDLQIESLAAPFPGLVVRIRGPVSARAKASHHLIRKRTTAAYNLLAVGDDCYMIPRTGIETPAPHFPHALGAAEFWGRWCYTDEQAYRTATVEDLAAALRTCSLPLP